MKDYIYIIGATFYFKEHIDRLIPKEEIKKLKINEVVLMDENLKEIITRIVEEIDPDKIILFGSQARGKSKNWSDYDICVLKKGIEKKRKLTQRIYHKLFGIGVSVDVIVETPEKFDELKNKWFLIYSEIAKFGRVIYEK